MTTKEIIDQHFNKYYDYYRKVCYEVSNKDNDVFENLLHDAYEEFFKVKPETITQFRDLEKLHFIGIKIIKGLYAKRFRTKKTKKGSTSGLFIAVDSSFRLDIPKECFKAFGGYNSGYVSEDDFYLIELADQSDEPQFKEQDYELLEQAIKDLLQDPDKTVSVTVFLQANEVSINKLHRDSKISRYYLTTKYNEGLNNLKNHIQNERNKTTKGSIDPHRTESGTIQVLDKAKREVAA